jgi:hypothetical protein
MKNNGYVKTLGILHGDIVEVSVLVDITNHKQKTYLKTHNLLKQKKESQFCFS